MAPTPNTPLLTIKYISHEIPIAALDDPAWKGASETVISEYWSGDPAPSDRHFAASLLWSDTALYVRFEALWSEPLIVDEKPDLTNKTHGLWDRDVCEIFVAPDKTNRNRYFEFEIAPTGEWIDIEIEVGPAGRQTDLDYSSGMESAARIEPDKIVMAIKIPWTAFGKTPKVGDVWLGNLFRCVGSGPTRGYLAWQPTYTAEPNFHVPSKFGEFKFLA